MNSLTMNEDIFRKFLDDNSKIDAAHDIAHIERVVKNTQKILLEESADKEVVMAAAWLHDCVSLPKDHPDRKKASTLAAQKAAEFLLNTSFPKNKVPAVAHAVEAHSYSAGRSPETIEAKIVQDADRLDAIGAIGIARCFMVGGALDRPLYSPSDPFAESREIDDSRWTLDHFYQKLFRLPELMHTGAAKKIAERRIKFMKQYLQELSFEIS